MDEHKFRLIFDATQAPSDWKGIAIFVFGLIAVLVVAIISKNKPDRPSNLTLFVIASIWIAIHSIGLINVNMKLRECRELLLSGNFQVLEGTVEKFKPMPKTGHSLESFEVKGVKFMYSDYDLSRGGFNNTSSHGGPIKEGLMVRIAYHTGRILRLEIAE